jgi:hypothetical protein
MMTGSAEHTSGSILRSLVGKKNCNLDLQEVLCCPSYMKLYSHSTITKTTNVVTGNFEKDLEKTHHQCELVNFCISC